MREWITTCFVILGAAAAWFLLQLAIWYLWCRTKPLSAVPRPATIIILGVAASAFVFVAQLTISLFRGGFSIVGTFYMSVATFLIFCISSYALSRALAICHNFNRRT